MGIRLVNTDSHTLRPMRNRSTNTDECPNYIWWVFGRPIQIIILYVW